MKKFLSFLFLVGFLGFCSLSVFAQSIDMDLVKANEEFRQGVLSYNYGFFNKANLHFEKALSLKPDNALFNFWLAKVLYKNGYSSDAVAIWQRLVKEDYKSAFLRNRIVQVNQPIRAFDENFYKKDYVVSNVINSKISRSAFLKNPASIFPDDLGGIFVTSFSGSEVLHFNANGDLDNRFNGGVVGFSKAFDVIYLEDEKSLLVSDFGDDKILKIDSKGFITQTIGSSGRGDGEFIGPQYMVIDDKGYLYVSDSGNRRISKFDLEGNFILSFGKKNLEFDGFQMPTGLAVVGGKIFISDQRLKIVNVFDPSGNFLGVVGKRKLDGPEGLFKVNDSEFLIADRKGIFSYNIGTEKLTFISDLDSSSNRLMKSVFDKNNNIVSVDFNMENITYLSNINNLYSGFDCEVGMIDSINFPSVEFDLNINDYSGEPFIGLEKKNFVIKENGVAVKDFDLVYKGDEYSDLSLVLLMDREVEVDDNRASLEYIVNETLNNMGVNDVATVISAEEFPVKELSIVNPKQKSIDELKSFVSISVGTNSSPVDDRRFDINVREAISLLSAKGGRKAIIYVTTGEHSRRKDFKMYKLDRLIRYAKANNVIFNYIVMDKDQKDISSLEEFAQQTSGYGFYKNDTKGIVNLVKSIKSIKTGLYKFVYKSKSNSDFGKKYLPLSVEIYHFNRTGKTESGFFSPRVY